MAAVDAFAYVSFFAEDGVAGSPVVHSEETPSFHWADYVVFTATLVIALGIGVFQAFTGDKQRTTKEYLMGNRLAEKNCVFYITYIYIYIYIYIYMNILYEEQVSRKKCFLLFYHRNYCIFYYFFTYCGFITRSSLKNKKKTNWRPSHFYEITETGGFAAISDI